MMHSIEKNIFIVHSLDKFRSINNEMLLFVKSVVKYLLTNLSSFQKIKIYKIPVFSSIYVDWKIILEIYKTYLTS